MVMGDDGTRSANTPRSGPASNRRPSDVATKSDGLHPLSEHAAEVSHHDADAAAGNDHMLERQFSFANTNLRQVYASIGSTSTDVETELKTGYLEAVLHHSPSSSFRELSNKTLSFWVKCFNKWRSMKEPAHLNGVQLPEILGLAKTQGLLPIVRLFDPEGARRLQTEGFTAQVLSRIQVSPYALMLAGVFLSVLISTQNKITFALGLFDTDDSGTLGEHEFALFANAMFGGLGAVFGATPPSPGALRRLASIYYTQISDYAAKRLRNLADSSRQSKEEILRQIKQRQSVAKKCPQQAATASGHKHGRRQEVPFAVLEDFVFGKLSDQDPLTLPFRLVLERFCPNRKVEFVDEFSENGKQFRLTRSAEVSIPDDSCSKIHAGELLTRPEVVFIRDIYKNLFALKSFAGEAELIRMMDSSRFVKCVREEVQLRLVQLNRDLGGKSTRLHGNDGLFKTWKFMCPKARPQHLKMFETWCEQFDRLPDSQNTACMAENMTNLFLENSAKPVLGHRDLKKLKEEFKELDWRGTGLIQIGELARSFQLADAVEVARSYDINDDGYMDEAEFLRLMCPADCRLPEMDPEIRQLFGELLEHESVSRRKSVEGQEASFVSKVDNRFKQLSAATPATIHPEVDLATWERWNNAFSALDKGGDAKVDVNELLSTGLLAPEVSKYVASIIDPEDERGFTREAFLEALLKANDRRRPTHLMD